MGGELLPSSSAAGVGPDPSDADTEQGTARNPYGYSVVGNSVNSNQGTLGRLQRTCVANRFLILIVVLFFIAFSVLILAFNSSTSTTTSTTSSSSASVLPSGSQIAACLNRHRLQPVQLDDTHFTDSVLIQHATVWDGLGGVFADSDIWISDGKIIAISTPGTRINPPDGVPVVDVKRRVVTPGLVDLHNHAGLDQWPVGYFGNDDTNEATSPLTPQVRAIDAINPSDPAFPAILHGGITTIQIMPGSANCMGGEGVLIKLKRLDELGNVTRFNDMIVYNHSRILKMATGENPKRVYGRGKGVMPGTRLGAAWLMRQQFQAAQQQLQLQQAFCSSTASLSSSSSFPSDLSLTSLVGVLQGDVRLHVHSYQTHDFEMMLRLAAEFGFHISAFHHALEAYRITPQLKANQIAVATFADLWGYKFEAYNASTLAPKILHDGGVTLVLKSDHPVTFSGSLMYEAAKSAYYGLDPMAALAAVTSNPARVAGLAGRVGSIAVGADGDVVVWDRDPLTIAAQPHLVFIEGRQVVNNSIPLQSHPSHTDTLPGIVQVSGTVNPCDHEDDDYDDDGNDDDGGTEIACYAVQGVDLYTLQENEAQPRANSVILVIGGIVSCIGSATSSACSIPSGCSLFTQTGGIVVPGFIHVSDHLGNVEIESEVYAQDGSGDTSISGPIRSALDSVRINVKHTAAAWMGGVTTSVTSPAASSSLLSGVSVAFHTCCGNVVDDVLVHTDCSLAINVDNNVRASSGDMKTISGQFALLRSQLYQAQRWINDSSASTSTPLLPSSPLYYFVSVLQRQIPLTVMADEVSVLGNLLRLQKQFQFRMVIVGASSAHQLVDELIAVKDQVSIILHARQQADSYSTLAAVNDAAVRLFRAGLRVGLAIADPGAVRNLRWEAGIAGDGLPLVDTLRLITSNVADMYGLSNGDGRIAVGAPANFVMFNGSPVSLQAAPQLVVSGTWVQCQPQQL